MRRTFGSVLLVLLAAAPAPGQEAKTLDPVVVTATKLETPAEQLGGVATVVTAEDFKTRHYATVEDALRSVPGVEVRRSGSLGKTASVTIRGANANQVQVLIDGVRVKSTTLGQAEFSDINPDLIERIEVIRGPQSTLYGADAIGGVIHIITKKGTGPLAGSLHQEAGNFNTYRTRAELGGRQNVLDYSFSASHLESNGQFQNDASETNALNARVGLALPWDSSLAFVLRYTRSDTELPVKFVSNNFGPLPIVPIIDSNNEQQNETHVITLSGRTRPVSWWESQIRLSRYDNTSVNVDLPDLADSCPFGAFGPCEFPSVIKVERREVEWVNHVHLGTWSTSTVGLEYRHEEGESQGASPFHARSWTPAVFFQQTFRGLDRLFMSAGFRVEDNSVFGTETTERGSLAWVIREWGTKLRGSAGAGFRAPTFNNLFFPGFSDPNLKPERSFSYDFGVDQRLWESRLRLGLTYFQNNFDELIGFVTTATFPFVRGVNQGRSRSAGIELTTEADLTDTLTALLNYTYTDSEVLAVDRPFGREPRHRWNAGLRWEPVRKLALFTAVHTESRGFESRRSTADPRRGLYNSGHTRVDAGGTWRVLDRHGFLQSLELTARIQNLLNESYAEARGFPALGINALVGLRASF